MQVVVVERPEGPGSQRVSIQGSELGGVNEGRLLFLRVCYQRMEKGAAF